jgi:hypothetical protein
MFGMLDYRAHKLYVVLVGPVGFILRLVAIIIIPFVCYLIGISISSNRAIQVAVTVVAMFVIAIPWYYLVKFIIAIPEAIFYFLIDVIPTDGRSKDQAKFVVWNGEFGINLLTIDKHPSEWTDEVIESISNVNVFSRIFSDKIQKRYHALRTFYLDNTDVVPSAYTAKQYLRRNNLAAPIWEQCISNKIYRGWVISYAVLLLLLAFNPKLN